MPRQDGTGPKGQGPKTGRGLGNCKPKSTKSSKSKVVRRPMRGQGQGRGQGRGLFGQKRS